MHKDVDVPKQETISRRPYENMRVLRKAFDKLLKGGIPLEMKRDPKTKEIAWHRDRSAQDLLNNVTEEYLKELHVWQKRKVT